MKKHQTLSVFNFETQSIHTIVKDGEVFFRASDLASALGFGNARQAIATHVDTDDLQKLEIVCDVQELDGTYKSKSRKTQMVNFVNESGMYALIFGSSKSQAKRFKKWVTSEVLPSIRKTGAYRLSMQAEYNRLCMQEAISVMKGSFHGLGLYHRRLEKATLHTKIAECEATLQLDFLTT